MSDELKNKYDTICYCIFNGVDNLSDGAKRIALKNVDHTNVEHEFVIALIASCSGVLGNRDLAIDGSIRARNSWARQYKKAIRVKKLEDWDTNVIDINELLDGLRPYAKELCGENFLYSDIYYEYYCNKERKKK